MWQRVGTTPPLPTTAVTSLLHTYDHPTTRGILNSMVELRKQVQRGQNVAQSYTSSEDASVSCVFEVRPML